VWQALALAEIKRLDPNWQGVGAFTGAQSLMVCFWHPISRKIWQGRRHAHADRSVRNVSLVLRKVSLVLH
jgi:hypothetical protein